MKRHRMATLTSQLYETELGVTVPPKIKTAGLDKEFLAAVKLSDELYAEMKKEAPVAAQYVLTGAHRKRSLMTLNARELYHISRLREDPHAQWEILELSAEMTKLAKSAMPLTMLLIGGKDVYPEIYQKVYGQAPKVLPPK